jgi:hypothetical protein
MKSVAYVMALLTGAMFPAAAQSQDQAFVIIPTEHKFKTFVEHLVDMDIDLKADAYVHIIGRCPITKISGGATRIWAGVAIDGSPDQYWMFQASMQDVIIDSGNEFTMTTTYATKIKAGKHKIYWNFGRVPASRIPGDGKFESVHGGTFMVQVFKGTVGGVERESEDKMLELKAPRSE